MSQASIEKDQRIARELSRLLNANPRRATALQPIPQMSGPMETPMPKGRISFKSPTAGLPIIPLSMTSTPTVAHPHDFETSSSSLSSLQSSDESSPSDASPSIMPRSCTTRQKLPDGKPVSLCRTFAPRGPSFFCNFTLTS
jgi:hypothetical protein